jgi:hypothetical protein
MNPLVLAVATLATTWIAAPAFAADLNGPASLKDQPVYRRAAGPCYVRGDVGYSWSSGPDSTFTQTDLGGTFITTRLAATSTIVGSPAAVLAVGRGRAASAPR